jgi:hypothetical protein
MRLLILALAVAACTLVRAEDSYRDDFNSDAGWEAQPTWLSARADNPVLRVEEGIGKFEIAQPGRGMKWLCNLEEPADCELTSWLVIRYRATNFAASRADYLLWVNDASPSRKGVVLLAREEVQADGQWHTRAVDLAAAHVISPITQIAVQCLATDAGDASLWVDSIAITDLPPADAEGYEPPATGGKEWPVRLEDAAQWTVQPTWLSNFSPASQVAASPEGLVFTVPEGGRGAKWSCSLPTPIEGAGWVYLRYRARGLRLLPDYALYIASAGGGKAPQEQYVIEQTALTPDGAWNVAIGRVTIPTIQTLAFHVQAQTTDASLEVAELRFAENRPQVSLSDAFDGAPDWPADMGGWHPVDLPPGNLAGPDLARRLGAAGSLPEGRITACGAPFLLRGGTDAVMMTPLREPGDVSVPLTGKAAEAYLLLAAQFPRTDEPSYVGTGGLIRQVFRLVARIEYADGTTEEQFPFALAARQHAISPWVRAYSLALDPAKPLRRLVLDDQMSRGAFGLVALTLSDRPGPATEATALHPTPKAPGERPIESRAAAVRRVGDLLAVDSWSLSMALDLSRGLRVTNLINGSGVGLRASITPGPLFRVLLKDSQVTSEQFMVERVAEEETATGPATRVDLRCDEVQPPLRASVWFDVADPREVGLRATLELNGHDPVATRLIFPEVSDLRFGDDAAATWVWCPRRGDVITADPVSLREAYAGAGNPFQVVGAFDPAAGTGLYMMTQDLTGVSRFYHVQKSGTGARLAVEYTPLHTAATPRTVMGCLQGGWHEQLGRYREWCDSWYTPAAPRKKWFQDVFSFRQQFLSFALPSRSGMFDPQSKTFRVKEVLDADAAAFGGVDYLHLFDWGWDPVHGRCGDYVPWDYLGGADNFRKAIEPVQQASIPVGLYIEGILIDPQSNLGKAHGAQWQMLNSAGQPYTHFAPSYEACGAVPAWQEYLSDTYARVQRETGAQGFYIDEYGFTSPGRWCYNPDHGHPVPVAPVQGELEMTRAIRSKLGPEAAIYTEESPPDVTSQFQDGSFTYNISSVSDEWSPTHINLYRFAFPDFKTIEIITCDRPLGTNVEAVKRILFNGEAIWIEGIADKWFSPAVRAQIALNRRVMRENRQCFTGRFAKPLVPTLVQGIYANQFGEREDLLGKTCWTVYNTGYRTLDAEVIAVDHAPGAQYLDEITGQPLTPRIDGDTAYLRLRMGPRDVAVISRGLYVQ